MIVILNQHPGTNKSITNQSKQQGMVKEELLTLLSLRLHLGLEVLKGTIEHCLDEASGTRCHGELCICEGTIHAILEERLERLKRSEHD